MVKWRCFKCKEDMVKAMVELEFSGVRASVEGIKCPVCSTKFVVEKDVIVKVLEAEGELSYK